MTTFDLAKLRLSRSAPMNHSPVSTSRQHDRRFLKGPIPWCWLVGAAQLPGQALHVAIALQFRAGVTKSETVTLTTTLLAELGVDRHGKYRGLKQLEQAGLVKVHREHGKNPQVTLCVLPRAATPAARPL